MYFPFYILIFLCSAAEFHVELVYAYVEIIATHEEQDVKDTENEHVNGLSSCVADSILYCVNEIVNGRNVAGIEVRVVCLKYLRHRARNNSKACTEKSNVLRISFLTDVIKSEHYSKNELKYNHVVEKYRVEIEITVKEMHDVISRIDKIGVYSHKHHKRNRDGASDRSYDVLMLTVVKSHKRNERNKE